MWASLWLWLSSPNRCPAASITPHIGQAGHIRHGLVFDETPDAPSRDSMFHQGAPREVVSRRTSRLVLPARTPYHGRAPRRPSLSASQSTSSTEVPTPRSTNWNERIAAAPEQEASVAALTLPPRPWPRPGCSGENQNRVIPVVTVCQVYHVYGGSYSQAVSNRNHNSIAL